MSTLDSLMKTQNFLDRKGAAKILDVSVRTVDRYIKSDKLSSTHVDGRVWLDKDEVEAYADGRSHRSIDKSIMSGQDMSTDKEVDSRPDNSDESVEKVEVIDSQKSTEKEENDVYQKLYVETKKELEEKQERLELANYRVGQLESRIRNSIPLLDYKKENLERDKREREMTEKLKETINLMRKMSLDLRYQRSSKQIFILLFIIVVVLQPLWLVFLGR